MSPVVTYKAMDATNQQKILNAGFTIIRDEVMHKGDNKYESKIKAKTKSGRSGLPWKSLPP
ncbi:MAG: hypothetical protein IPH18_18265 [Chitinophagaceae bacterium]|nr:hypothetical protein [Chitinophagaceae bacterium]